MASNEPNSQPSPPDDLPDHVADVAELSYEQARDELIEIVARLEGGQIGLEDSMALWQRGEALAAHCSTWLDGAEAKLGADGPGSAQA